jgi:hypothetical protein
LANAASMPEKKPASNTRKTKIIIVYPSILTKITN